MPFYQEPHMTELTITYRGVVYPWNCDHMGHMNVMWYVGKFDEACWQLLSMLGINPARLKQEHAGMAAIEQHNEYKRELHAGDPITIRSTIVRIGKSSIRMLHEMTDDATGKIAATSSVVGVYMSASDRKAQAFPLDIRERALTLMNDNAADTDVVERCPSNGVESLLTTAC